MYDETSQGTEVDGLWFTSLPSSSKGVLYFDYDGRDEYEVEKRESFTRRDLDDLAFVPDEDYDGFVTVLAVSPTRVRIFLVHFILRSMAQGVHPLTAK